MVLPIKMHQTQSLCAECRVEAGRNFLEKIIQVPLHLPPADRLTLRQFTFEGVESALNLSDISLPEVEVFEFVRHFESGLEVALTTPRQARRYTNALMFALPILKGEVRVVDQLLIEGIRTFYPKLYLVLRDNPEVFLIHASFNRWDDNVGKKTVEVINQGIAGLPPFQQEAAKKLMENLFPRLEGVFSGLSPSYGDQWDNRWAKEQRICSEMYFYRYFQYGVPPRDVADQAIEQFLSSLKTLDTERMAGKIKEFTSQNKAERFIFKLRQQEDSVDSKIAEHLAIGLAENATNFPQGKGLFSSITAPFPQAAILVAKLIDRVPFGSDRETLARKIIQEADSIPFAFECFRWMRKDESDKKDRIVPESIEHELGTMLATRVRDSAKITPPYISSPENSPALFYVWNTFGPPDEVAAYLRTRFASDTKEVLTFLTSYVGLSWGMESGIPHKSEFIRENYDAISKIRSPAEIVTQLKILYDHELDAPQYHHPSDTALEKRIAHQFVFIHNAVQSESQGKAIQETSTDSPTEEVEEK
jgi:hypothetical protein